MGQDFFQNYRNMAKFRLEDAVAKGRSQNAFEVKQLKKKNVYLEGLKVPVDCKELVDRVLR